MQLWQWVALERGRHMSASSRSRKVQCIYTDNGGNSKHNKEYNVYIDTFHRRFKWQKLIVALFMPSSPLSSNNKRQRFKQKNAKLKTKKKHSRIKNPNIIQTTIHTKMCLKLATLFFVSFNRVYSLFSNVETHKSNTNPPKSKKTTLWREE